MLDGYEIDWQAFGAIATFSAVLVALIPAFDERERRKALARNVRARLLAHLMILRRVAEKSSPEHIVILSDEEMGAVHAMSLMMTELSILGEDEHDQLWQLMADLKMLEAYPSTIDRMNKDSLVAIDEISERLRRSLKEPSILRRIANLWYRSARRSIPAPPPRVE